MQATGARLQTSIHGITDAVLGTCEVFEEKGVGDERYNFFTGCPKAKTATILLRGGGEQFLEETHRSIHDALCIVKRSLVNREVVAGGGAIEMELSSLLKEKSKHISGKQQLIMAAFAKALEVIPKQVSENAGMDATDVLNKLRKAHFVSGSDGKWMGVDVLNEGICDTFLASVWEPAANKINSLGAATEAAALILSIDETVKNPQSEKPGAPSQGVGLGPGGAGGGGRGRKMVSEAMGGQGWAGMTQGKARGALKMMKGRGGA